MTTYATINRGKPVTPPPTTVTLTMSEDTALALLSVVGLRITGSGPVSQMSGAIYGALCDVGLKVPDEVYMNDVRIVGTDYLQPKYQR